MLLKHNKQWLSVYPTVTPWAQLFFKHNNKKEDQSSDAEEDDKDKIIWPNIIHQSKQDK